MKQRLIPLVLSVISLIFVSCQSSRPSDGGAGSVFGGSGSDGSSSLGDGGSFGTGLQNPLSSLESSLNGLTGGTDEQTEGLKKVAAEAGDAAEAMDDVLGARDLPSLLRALTEYRQADQDLTSLSPMLRALGFGALADFLDMLSGTRDIWRFVNRSTVRFYFTSDLSTAKVTALVGAGFEPEGIAFRLPNGTAGCRTALYQCYSQAMTSHFLTADPSCEAAGQTGDTRQMESVLGNACTVAIAGSYPLTRVYYPATNATLFSSHWAEEITWWTDRGAQAQSHGLYTY